MLWKTLFLCSIIVLATQSHGEEVKCPDFYKNLVVNEGNQYTLNASFFFGWMNKEVTDDETATRELHDRGNAMREKLVGELIKQGFKRVDNGSDSSHLILERPMLDKSGAPITLGGNKPLLLRVSLTTVQDKNSTAIPNPSDGKYKDLADRWFKRVREAVERDGGLVYIWSHARGGAGPDPYPMDLSWGGYLGYFMDWWNKTKFKQMFPQQGEGTIGSKAFFLASCSSEDYFGDSLRKELAVRSKENNSLYLGLTTRKLYDHEGEYVMRAVLDNFAKGGCLSDLESGLKSSAHFSSEMPMIIEERKSSEK